MDHELNGLQDLARRNNPNYTQIAGLINKDLARKLRVYCADQSITIAEVMEEAITDYLGKKQPPTSSTTESEDTEGKGRGKKGGDG